MIESSQTRINSGAGGRDRTPTLGFTKLLPSVRQRSSSIECTIFSGLRGGFRSSVFVTGCRRWGHLWGQSNLAFPPLTDTVRWITSLLRAVTFVDTIYWGTERCTSCWHDDATWLQRRYSTRWPHQMHQATRCRSGACSHSLAPRQERKAHGDRG